MGHFYKLLCEEMIFLLHKGKNDGLRYEVIIFSSLTLFYFPRLKILSVGIVVTAAILRLILKGTSAMSMISTGHPVSYVARSIVISDNMLE